MSRFADRDPSLIYQAAENFRQCCLLSDGSVLFDNASVWSLANLKKLHEVFVDAPDGSDRTFEEKFEDQVKPSGQTITRLAAEVLVVYFLFPSNVGGYRKRELVNKVLGWGGDSLDPQHPISRAFETGIGSGGQAYNNRRPNELWYLIDLMLAWKTKPIQEAADILKDPWKFEEFVDALDGSGARQIRHMLLHLLFPDQFERIASKDHKWRINHAFSGLLKDPPEDMDRRLFMARKELEALIPGKDLDFYYPPLADAWHDKAESSESVAVLEIIHHKRQAVFYGPPGTGKTYRANAIAERLIHSAALRQWGASRYFRDHEAVAQAVKSNIHVLQLHPAYTYEDFIRGLHFVEGKTEYRPGFLLRLISDKMDTEAPDKRLPHVLILDEMNRTDLSRMFGECFSLLEYRGKRIDLPGHDSQGKGMTIEIPCDLYIFGTMNLIDQSVEQIDFALRRRFHWIFCSFDSGVLQTVIQDKWEANHPGPYPWERVAADFARFFRAASNLNDAIQQSELLGQQYEIGHTYFFEVVYFLQEDLQGTRNRKYFLWNKKEALSPVTKVWTLSLRPLLEQYLSGLRLTERQDEMGRLEKAFLSPPESV